MTTTNVWDVGVEDVERLARWVFDPTRTNPVLIVSRAGDTGQPRIPLPVILESVEGRDIEVVVFTDRDTSVMYSDITPERLNVFGGAVRLMQVRASRADPPARHPLLLVFPDDDQAVAAARLRRIVSYTAPYVVPGTASVRREVHSVGEALREALAGTPLAFPDPAPTNPASADPAPADPATAPAEAACQTPVRPAPTSAAKPTPVLLDRRRTPAAAEPTAPASGDPQPAPPPAAPAATPTTIDVDAVGRIVEDKIRDTMPGLLDRWLRDVVEGAAVTAERERTHAANEQVVELQDHYLELLDGGELPTVHDDPEDQLRWEIDYLWLTETPPSSRKPLRRYSLAAGFIDGLNTDIVPRRKAVQVMVDVLTGDVWNRRKTHQWYSGLAGSAARTSPAGGVGWRTSIKTDSPGAPRLMWFDEPDSTIWFEQVGHHDVGI